MMSKTTKTTCTQLRCACGRVWAVSIPDVVTDGPEGAFSCAIQVHGCPICIETKPGRPVGFSIGGAFFALVTGGGEAVTANEEPDG